MSEHTAPAPVAPVPPSVTGSVRTEAVKEAVDQLRAALPKLQEHSPGLANGVNSLLRGADDPQRLNQAEFQHRIAYVVRDTERATGPLAFQNQLTRDELLILSTTAPGLENKRVETLMVDSSRTSDVGLLREIRRTAIEIGKQADQDTTHIRSQLDALENRLRLAPAAAAPQPTPASTTSSNGAAAPGLDSAGRPVGGGQAPSPQSSSATDYTGATTSLQQVQRTQTQQQPAPNRTAEALVPMTAAAAVASSFLRGFRKLGTSDTEPWEPATTPFGDRLKAFEARQQTKKDQELIGGVEASGKTALSSLQSFANREGSVMMNRIREAAASNPNGIEGVLSGMRPGGKYADLRQQFNTALADEKGFAAAYDKAAAAVNQYGQDRAGAQPVIARQPDAAAITAKFEALERSIGEKIGETPSRTDGKAMLDDLRKQAAEIFKAVAEGIKNLFVRATSGASASPSPG